ncbi:hypothetical protein AVEN_215159-1 [Araneus ventricosus]|uniref:Tc3 transposase DNA binding domain-containing protein n=1 Tax=Araneus ventricosus TaxID=182803 RepID=A0A4Y2VK94_ARAVE|nr:hypothetical protein AVEN_174943-1 [Araneus ventricosus]GBO24840.1 hypothetical protein AVEN_215159-1 [Araneus ventricosus]
MGKATDLSGFDRGQIIMVRRFGTSITETARLVGCSRYAVVSIHEKCINDGDTSSRRQGVGRPCVIKGKGRRRLCRLVKQNRRQTVAQLTPNTMQVQAQVFWNTQLSELSGHCWIWDCAADSSLVCLCCPSVIVNYAYRGPGNIETGPRMSGRELPGRMNLDFSFITSMVVSGYVVCQANSCSPLVQQVIHRLMVAVLCFGGRSHVRLWDP